MQRVICLLVATLFLTSWSSVIGAEPVPWPQANGPTSNFNPRRYDAKLIDDLSAAQTAWTSEFRDLGFAKGSSSGYLRHLTDADTHPGSASGLIVAEGKVFASSFRPRGDIWAENMPHVQHEKVRELLADPARAAVLRRNAAIDADDLTVAIDFETGKTVWTAVEAGRGLNRYSGKRLQFHATPVYHAGRVFSLGSTGIVYCYDAAIGAKRWEEDKSALVATAAAEKAALLKHRNGLAAGDGMGASLVVADGVLIVPEYDTPHTDISLRGLAIDSGKTLWTVRACNCRSATPAVWTHAKKQYLLTATAKGQLRLIDPQGGKVLWTVDGLEPTYYSLTCSERHVFVNVKSAHDTRKKEGESWGRIGAYRLSPEKAEPAWSAPDEPQFWFENHMDICAMRRVLVRDGRVYYFTQGHTLEPERTNTYFSIFSENDGAVLYVSKSEEFGHPSVEQPQRSTLGQFWLVEDRILSIPDASHSDRSTMQWLTADPADIRRLGKIWKPAHKNTTAYEVFIELPYVDGRFLMRTWQGQVVCYDLRAK